MKLTDKIKEKIDNAKSEEEVKTILESVKGGAEDAGVILDDEDLDKASGGIAIPLPPGHANGYAWSPKS